MTETRARLNIITLAALLTLTAGHALAQSAAKSFVEDFTAERWEQGRPEGWALSATARPPGLRWHGPGGDEPFGLGFSARSTPSHTVGRGVAYRPWPIGARPFRLRCTLRITKDAIPEGLGYLFSGVSVGLSSAKPGEMTKDDITAMMSITYPGIGGGVRRGEMWQLEGADKVDPQAEKIDLGGVGHFTDRNISGLVSQWGSSASYWPRELGGELEGVEVDLRIRRDAGGLLTFSAYVVGRDRPWWRGTWQLPEKLADVPLRYLVVHRVPAKREHTAPGHAGFDLAGRITRIEAAPLEQTPRVASVEPIDALVMDGAKVRLTGEGFGEGAKVKVNGKPALDIQVVNEQQVTFRAPKLPAGRLYDVELRNRDGLSDAVYQALPYGRMFREVRPFEARPAGGDIVHITGAGFGKDVEVLFGDKPGRVVERTPLRLRVATPEHEAGPVDVVVRDGDGPFGKPQRFGFAPHPFLHFKNADELAALRKKFNDPRYAHYRRDILAAADRQLNTRFTATNPGGTTTAVSALSWGYLLSGEQKYLDRFNEWVAYLENKDLVEGRYAGFSLMGTGAMAAAYDMLYADLDPEVRAGAAKFLSSCLDTYLAELARPRDWFVTNISNTNAVANCGAALAALALQHSHPDADEALKLAKELVRNYANGCIRPDGGNVEGQLYWNYGFSYYLTMAGTLRDATGDTSMLDHPHVKKNVRFLETMLTAGGRTFRYNDTHGGCKGILVGSLLGSYHDQPLMRWFADYVAEKSGDRPQYVPYALMWRDEKPTPEFPGLPTLSVLEDLNWGVMRSEPVLSPALIVGVKGNEGPLSHHAQRDLGSFVLHVAGDRMLVDRGYNHKGADEHTLPLIDGQGPGKTGSRIVEASEKGPWRMMTLDSTKAYGEHARRVRRHLVMHGSDTLIVLDDLLPAEGKPGKIATQFQTDKKVKVDGRSAIVGDRRGPVLVLTTFGPDIALKHRKTPRALVGEYTAVEDTPLVTVIQVAESLDAAGELKVPSVERDGDAIAVALPDGATARFVNGDRGWRPEANE